MEKKSTQKFNLAQYSAVAGALMAGGSINAQITYVDVNPDKILDVNSTATDGIIDFNGDATPDLIFTVGTNTGSASGYSSKTNFASVFMPVANVFVGTTVGAAPNTFFVPTLLANGDNIDAAGNFGNYPLPSPNSAFGVGFLGFAGSYFATTNPGVATSTFAGGYFLGKTDAYLGVKFKIGTANHYGWVRFDVATDATTITLKDHAYNTVADEGINAGQMLDLADVAVSNKVTIKTHLDEAFINVTPDLIGGEMVIINMAGQEVKSSVIGDVNAKMTFEGLDTGIYTLVARFESGSVNKKIYVR